MAEPNSEHVRGSPPSNPHWKDLNGNPFQLVINHAIQFHDRHSLNQNPQLFFSSVKKSFLVAQNQFLQKSPLAVTCENWFEKLVVAQRGVLGQRQKLRSFHLSMASISNGDDVITSSLIDSSELKRRNAGKEDGNIEPSKPKSQSVKVVQKAKEKSLLKLIVDGLIAGAVAGVTVETILYPIDTIKTRLQVARQGGGVNFKGLYSGLSGNIFGVLPASAIFIGVYEPVKQKLLSFFPDNYSAFAHLSAGALGGLAASLVRVPTEVIKQRMQLREFSSPLNAINTIVAKEGARGLFAGYSSFLLRDLPFDAIQFMIYEQLKIAGKRISKRDLYDSEMAFIGAISGAATGALTTPLDVIKTRLMTQGTSGQFVGIGDCIAKTLAEEGASAFFKGIGPRVLWIGIGGSIFFGVLEKTKQLIASFDKKQEKE